MNRQNNKMTTGISALVLGKKGRHEDGRSGVIARTDGLSAGPACCFSRSNSPVSN